MVSALIFCVKREKVLFVDIIIKVVFCFFGFFLLRKLLYFSFLGGFRYA